MSEFQGRCLEAIRWFHDVRRKTYIPPTLCNIAVKVSSNRLAVYSAMQALERQGKVAHFRHRPDMWGLLCYYEIESAAGERQRKEERDGISL